MGSLSISVQPSPRGSRLVAYFLKTDHDLARFTARPCGGQAAGRGNCHCRCISVSGAIKAGAETVLSGKRFDDAANKNTLGGYGLLNLYAGYDVAPGWSLFGRWNNVGNKNYALAKNYATAGLNLFVGIRFGM